MATQTAISAEARLESSLEDFFRRRIRAVGGYTIKLAPLEAGTPDRLVIMPGGRMYLVELKTATGMVSAVQSVWHRRIRQLGGRVHVIYGKQGCVDWIRVAVSASDPHRKNARRR